MEEAVLILTAGGGCRVAEPGTPAVKGPPVCLLEAGVQAPEWGDAEIYGVLGVQGHFRWWYDHMGMLHYSGQTLAFRQRGSCEPLYTKLVAMTGEQAMSKTWVYFPIAIEPDYWPKPITLTL